MATFFATNEFESLESLAKVLCFVEVAGSLSPSLREFRKDALGLSFQVKSNGLCLLFKNRKALAKGSFGEIMDSLMENSREPSYETLEEWLASRVTSAATYRRLADKRMEAARKEHARMCSLESSLTRSLHDLRKTAKIAKEGHQ